MKLAICTTATFIVLAFAIQGQVSASPVASQVIVDNLDPGYVETGVWSESGAIDGFRNSSRWSSRSGAKAVFKPNLPAAGRYEVFARWSAKRAGNLPKFRRTKKAAFTVSYAGTEDTVIVNQDENNNEWFRLGTYDFLANHTEYVELTRSEGWNNLVADAVMFRAESVSSPKAASVKATGDDLPKKTFLYFGGTAVNRVDVDQFEHIRVYAEYLVSLNKGMSGAMEIAVDRDNGKIYFVQADPTSPYHYLFRANLDLSEQEVLFRIDHFAGSRAAINEIAVDSINNRLYIDGIMDNQGGLWRYDLDGTNFTKIANVSPTHFVLDAANTQMFWMDTRSSQEYQIMRANLDGQNAKRLYAVTPLSGGSVYRERIALDSESRRLYWRNGGAVESGDLEGSQPYATEFVDDHNQLLAIAAGGKRLYVTLYQGAGHTSSIAEIRNGEAVDVLDCGCRRCRSAL